MSLQDYVNIDAANQHHVRGPALNTQPAKGKSRRRGEDVDRERKREEKVLSFVKEGLISNFIEVITALKYKCFVKSPGGESNEAMRGVITAGYNSSKTPLKYI